MAFKRPTTIQIIIAVMGGLGLILVLYTPIDAYVFNWQYTGFGPKTIWDWLELLIIPVVLAVGGYVFNRADKQAELERSEQQARAEQERAEQQARVERELAQDAQRETALQSYFDRMAELLLTQGLLASQPKDPVRDVARAHTLATLRKLDAIRKGSVIRFLAEAGLIRWPELGSVDI